MDAGAEKPVSSSHGDSGGVRGAFVESAVSQPGTAEPPVCSTVSSTVDWMNSEASFWMLVISYIWRNLGYDVVLLDRRAFRNTQ